MGSGADTEFESLVSPRMAALMAKAEEDDDKPDMVNSPSHYTRGKVECIDAIEAACSHLTGMEAVCTANAIKYLWRWQDKGGKEDLKKARYYINRMLGEC